MTWQVQEMKRWIVVDTDNHGVIVEYPTGSHPKQFTSYAAAQFASDDLNNPEEGYE